MTASTFVHFVHYRHYFLVEELKAICPLPVMHPLMYTALAAAELSGIWFLTNEDSAMLERNYVSNGEVPHNLITNETLPESDDTQIFKPRDGPSCGYLIEVS